MLWGEGGEKHYQRELISTGRHLHTAQKNVDLQKWTGDFRLPTDWRLALFAVPLLEKTVFAQKECKSTIEASQSGMVRRNMQSCRQKLINIHTYKQSSSIYTYTPSHNSYGLRVVGPIGKYDEREALSVTFDHFLPLFPLTQK